MQSFLSHSHWSLMREQWIILTYCESNIYGIAIFNDHTIWDSGWFSSFKYTLLQAVRNLHTNVCTTSLFTCFGIDLVSKMSVFHLSLVFSFLQLIIAVLRRWYCLYKHLCSNEIEKLQKRFLGYIYVKKINSYQFWISYRATLIIFHLVVDKVNPSCDIHW